MAKFNVVQKKRRAQIADRKRAIHGDPVTGKLKTRPQSLSVSGKRKRKLLKKWRRDQKEAVEKGLLNMEDVEMASAEGTSQDTNRTPTAFHMKKSLKLKKLKRRGKGKGKSSTLAAAAETSRDAMTE
ncbi:uncharacterized protein LOC121254823 [Juglans microcarpa x Juglans regia]|uniref:uncharacterized protein LOC121254823 n=1 Tax=Juglans microcarpa x Juglans regia TaxID=2249226 RepID=UPI001B7EA20B|nr:uncharacterized protein LOC121254823 [Juglans microcarpa x Juglans regia]